MVMKAERTAFDLVGDDEVGVVLLHGFTGTPYEVRYLGDQLARAGHTVRAPLLPGHGTSIEDLDRTTWEDWAEHVERAVDALRVRCPRVAIVGQSLGGLLALHVASRRRDIAAVASLAAPLWLEGLSALVAKWTTTGLLSGVASVRCRPSSSAQIASVRRRPASSARVRAIPKLGGADVRDRRAKAENPCYPAIPTRALGQLLAFMKVVDAALPQVSQPVLVLHARQDHTAPVACATRIAERTRARRIRILPESYHLIAVDVERDIVAAEVTAFLRTYARPRPSTGDLSCAM